MAEAFEVKAKARFVPISPRKVRLVVDAVRGMDADIALDKLRFMPQRAAEPVYKLIESAVANAEQNFGLEMDELYVSRILPTKAPGIARRLMVAGLPAEVVFDQLCAARPTLLLFWPSVKWWIMTIFSNRMEE